MQKRTVVVCAAVVDVKYLRLYFKDGTSTDILQGDPELKRVLDIIKEPMARRETVEVTLYPDAETVREQPADYYAAYEEKSTAGIRFFKVAKDWLKNVFGAKPSVAPHVPVKGNELTPVELIPVALAAANQQNPNAPDLSQLNTVSSLSLEKKKKDEPLDTPTNRSIDEIMQHAEPATSKGFSESGTRVSDRGNSTHTIVATIPNGKGGHAIIPDAQKLNLQIERAAKLGSTKGVDAFFARMAKVAEERAHSIEDLLKFMARNDMPITDDGRILCYKRLKFLKTEKGHEIFVDSHSGKVTQRIGSRVQMKPEMVDHNRSNECSNGLHIARRDYIGGFTGDVLCLAYMAPEDVIAVPHGDSNKLRCCGYELIVKMSNRAMKLVCEKKDFAADSESQKILARALANGYPKFNQIVEIGGSYGSNLTITDLATEKVAKADHGKATNLDLSKQVDGEDLSKKKPVLNAPKVDVTKLAAETQKAHAINEASDRATRVAELSKIIMHKKTALQKRREAAGELSNMARKVKKSVVKIGGTQEVSDEIKVLLSGDTK